MGKTMPLVVYIDTNIGEWLSKKAENGYKKSSLVRKLLHDKMELEGEKHE